MGPEPEAKRKGERMEQQASRPVGFPSIPLDVAEHGYEMKRTRGGGENIIERMRKARASQRSVGANESEGQKSKLSQIVRREPPWVK